MNFPGLISRQVEQSRAQNGTNVLMPPCIFWWQEFLSKFEDPVIRIIAALVSFGVGLLARHISIESIGIVTAILLVTGLAPWNGSKAIAVFDALNPALG